MIPLFISNGLSAGAIKLSALLELFYESRKEFVQVIHPHHADGVILEVNLIDFLIVPKDIIHHLQIRDLSKPC